ncbi:hypothetical protein BDZ89DRAFT_556229 [Hymenopellis radicata]|nr:hypothetical protein BDZ89DRAFT_556229 [Hymenopellis radicata]
MIGQETALTEIHLSAHSAPLLSSAPLCSAWAKWDCNSLQYRPNVICRDLTPTGFPDFRRQASSRTQHVISKRTHITLLKRGVPFKFSVRPLLTYPRAFKIYANHMHSIYRILTRATREDLNTNNIRGSNVVSVISPP